jgi:uncharacterized protein YjdB
MASTVVAAGCGNTKPVMPPPKATLVSIVVTPANPSIAKGTAQQFAATGTYSDNTAHDLSATVAWTSATAAIATISSAGLATSLAAGTTVITATSGTVSGSTTLTVTPVKAPTLVSIAVSPANPSIARGATQQLTATGTYDDGSTQDVSATATWSSAAATATVSSTGLATGVAAGTTVITATSAGVSGTTTLTVKPVATVLTSIAVTPVAPTINAGTKQQFTATATFDDATTKDITSIVTWSSANLAIATVSNTAGTNGQVTAVDRGTTVITATSGPISGSTTLTVTKVTLVSITVTPTNPSIARETTQQFAATGTFADATTQDFTSIATWASETMATATISNVAGMKGSATAIAAGTTIISATSGAISGNTTLTVSGPKLVSIVVIPVSPAIAKGTNLPLTAAGIFDDATNLDLTTLVIWSSANLTTATVSNTAGTKGQVTGVNPGSSVITATSGSISGSVTLTVTSPPLVSIAITPAMPSVAKGSTQQFTATATFGDNTTQDVTTVVTWTSAPVATATISNAPGSNGLASAIAEGTAVISASVGTIKAMVTLTVTAANLAEGGD